eukprot:7086948-Ditylum_brightwellii.AAC.1
MAGKERNQKKNNKGITTCHDTRKWQQEEGWWLMIWEALVKLYHYSMVLDMLHQSAKEKRLCILEK